ncbi:MAG: hypothetical protein ISR77_30200 [Pirellulaceae bacterium]|nr:hypothetical protein [Pirellulaceae bacterium]
MPDHENSSDGTAPRRRSWRRYSLRSLMGLMLICALFFGYVAITVKRHRDQWDREQEVIARLEEIKARGVVVESLKPKWLQFLLPKAYDKYFERVTKVVVANGPQFNEADLGRLKTLSHLQDLQIVQHQAIQPTPPGVTDEKLEAFFKEMPAVYHTAEQRMLSLLSKNPTRPQGTFIGPCRPGVLVDFLMDMHGVAFLRVDEELECSDVLVVYDKGLSLTDNFDHQLGKQLDYRIAPPWLWLIKGPSATLASDATTDGSSVVRRDLPLFTKEEAVSRLQKLGCTFQVDEEQPGEPIVMVFAKSGQFTDEDLARLRGLKELQRLALMKTAVTDGGLAHLKDFSKLQGLLIAGPFITEAGIAHLEGLTSMKTLALDGPQFGNAALVHLRSMSELERLWLEGTRVDGAGFEQIEGLTKIQSLKFSSKTADGSVLRHIKNWTRLTELRLNGVNLTDEDLKHIEHLTELTVLDLSWAKLKGPGLAHLRNMKKLEELDLHYVRVADESLAHLSQLTNIRILNLWHSGITDTGLEHLSELANVQELDLGNTEITGAGLALLGQMRGLKKLRLLGTKIVDEDLVILKGMEKLEDLDLKDTEVTDDAIGRLKTALPECEIRR